MSFSSEVKDELVRIKADKDCCPLAELSAIIRVGGNLKLRGKDRIAVEISTESASTARLVFSILKKSMNIHAELFAIDNKMLRRGHLYVVDIEDARDALIDLGIIDYSGGYMNIHDAIPERFMENECCKRAYLRGSFLGAGSLSDPEKGYHLEIVTHSDSFAVGICNLLEEYEVSARIIERKGSYVVYIKEGDQISDLLNVIGAHKALLSFENVRILKSMRNSVNRIVNCETANLNKTVNAAVKQISDIEFIESKIGLESLPDNLRTLAELRRNHAEASLKELGEMLGNTVGKSGINHRLKKIEAIADGLRREESSS